jgi:Na+/H+ antiporter NhaD/arsenite permease-like protein
VLLIAPVTLLVCDRLDVNPAPFLIVEALTANIAGAATLVGDPTSIIIGTGGHLSFITFSANMGPAVLLVLAALLVLLPRMFPGFFTVDPDRVADVMALNEKEAIRNRTLLIQRAIVLVAVFVGFVTHKQIHMEPSLVAMAGAGILIVISGLSREFYLSSVEWESLLFFAGLFIMVGALVRTGIISGLAHAASHITRGDAWTATVLILSVSFTLGSFINNVPYAATMTPVVGHMAASIPAHTSSGVLWWALLLGTVLGGNLTPVGASANIVAVGIAQRAGHPVSFWEFTRRGGGSDRGLVCTFRRLSVGAVLLLELAHPWPDARSRGAPEFSMVSVCGQRTSKRSSPSCLSIPTQSKLPVRSPSIICPDSWSPTRPGSRTRCSRRSRYCDSSCRATCRTI